MLRILLSGIVLLALNSCAVFDKNRPGWDEFTPLATDGATNLHVEVIGDGKPVLLIHGFAASKYTWRKLAPALAKTHQVHMLDLKGFGESPKPDDGAYSIYDQARNVLHYIKQENLQELVVVGHSFGGGVALASALHLSRAMPGRLKKLVLIDSIAYPQDVPFFIEVLATPLLGPAVAHSLPATFQVRDVLKTAYYNDELITETDVNAYATPLKESDAISAMLATARTIWPSDLETFSRNYHLISVPTKIIWGKNDAIVPLEVGQQLHESIGNSTLDVLEQCGHIPHEECPEKAVPVIVKFIRSSDTSDAY